MGLIILGILGIIIGAAGIEILHAKKPEMMAKLQNNAKKCVDRVCSSKSSEENDDE